MLRIVSGDLLDQGVEAIVNPWNRNFIPYWLLWPQGVSGAIRRRAGREPFRELARAGLLALGQAVVTTAGNLPFAGIIHVAGLTALWTSNEKAIRLSTANALAAASGRFSSLAFPLIGAGTGGVKPDLAESWMSDEIGKSSFSGDVLIVRYAPNPKPASNPGPAVVQKTPSRPAAVPSSKKQVYDTVAAINGFLATNNEQEFWLDFCDGSTLRLIGSFDLSYYHELTVTFLDTQRLSLATGFSLAARGDVFHVVTTEEEGEAGYLISWTDTWDRRHEVFCGGIESEAQMVRHYDDDGGLVWRPNST